MTARFTILGFAAGALAGAAETARLVWLQTSNYLPPLLPWYAVVIDGAVGAALGFVLAIAWIAIRRARRIRPGADIRPLRSGADRLFTRRVVLAMTASAAAGAGLMSLTIARKRSGPVLTAGSLVAAPSSSASVQRPPNIVFVTIDTLRSDQLGSYGQTAVATPALDAVAAAGARFTNHFVQQPQTNPSHASMFLGMYPSSSGDRVHMVDKPSLNLATLASVLQSSGYQTAGLYSWMSLDGQYSGLDRGFQTYLNVASQPADVMGNPAIKDVLARYRAAEQFLSVPQMANQILPWKSDVESTAKGKADLTTAAALAQLQAFRPDSPFFLWVHYFDPHYPYEPPPDFAAPYLSAHPGTIDGSISTVNAIESGKLTPQGAELRRLMAFYQAEIGYLDTQIGNLFAAIDQSDQAADTALLISGDHGESFGEHSTFDEDGEFFHPHTLFNTEIQVPFLMRYPARLRAGTTVDAITQGIDIFPTVLELAGLPVPGQAQGSSVVGLLDGTDDGNTRAAFSSMWDYTFTSAVSQGWKLIQNNATGQQALFDLSQDVTEQQDQRSDQQDIGTSLSSTLDTWMKQANVS